jgi:alkaline phosphatase
MIRHLFLLFVFCVACRAVDVKRRGELTQTNPPKPATPGETIHGIILVIGDGMGPGAVSLLLQARPEGALSNLMKNETVGVIDTTPFGALVTDSAAGGTALACGIQTRPRMLGTSPDGEPIENILELAKRKGVATGVVTTSSLTDATPAAFLTHSVSRLEVKDLASQIEKNPPTIAIGGGSGLIKESEHFILHSAGDLPFAITKKRPTLLSMAQEALRVLEKSPKGFVLMIEAAHIDKASHGHDAPALYAELMELDDLLEELAPRAASNKILLVVTADHETGGVGFHYRKEISEERKSTPQTLPSGEVWTPNADFGLKQDLEMLAKGETPPSITWSTYTHTSLPVFVVAAGPGSEWFGGLHAQWQVGERLHGLLSSHWQ